VRDFVEKPRREEAPSNLAIAGRYVLTPDVFDVLEQTERGKNDEIQLTDALRKVVSVRPAYGLKFAGRRFDAGDKLEFIKTNITFALMNPELTSDLSSFIRQLASSL